MGQQQLLLLVLGIVIVGIAVVAGIQAFSEGKTKADRDAAQSDAMRVISDMQAWKLKPAAFGGGSGASGFTGVSFKAIGIPDSSITNAHYQTTSACIKLTAGASATLDVFVRSSSAACAATMPTGNKVGTATIAGTTVNSVSWAY